MTYTISPENKQLELDIQQKINKCLDNFESFCFDAGAGAGKTYALQKSIEHILKTEGENLKLRNQKILCITYTNAAKDEILSRLGKNSTILVSTIHEFLWEFISIQQESLTIEHKNKIIDELHAIDYKINENSLSSNVVLPEFQNVVCKDDFIKTFYSYYGTSARDFRDAMKNYDTYFETCLSNISNFKNLVKDINKKSRLSKTLKDIEDKESKKIIYNPVQNRDKLENYVISHDTLLLYCKNIITNKDILKRLFSDRYPYILIDE